MTPIPSGVKQHQNRFALLWVGLVLLAGFALHTVDIGAAPLQGDEAWLAFLAYDAGYNGHRSLLGVISSAGVNQPPFFHDIFSIPFAFHPDLRIARIFMAGLQLVGAASLYLMVRRYWSSRTALVALICYTVVPRSIWAGRYLWNPYLAIPFVIGYLLTGFLISEGKRWGRWLHPAMLACAIGAHPVMAILAPLSLGFYARDWFMPRQQRWKIARDYLIGIGLAAIILLPWGIGLLEQRLTAPTTGNFSLRNRTPFMVIWELAINSIFRLDLGAIGIPGNVYHGPSNEVMFVYSLIGSLTLLGSIVLFGRALIQIVRTRRVRNAFPDLMIGLAYFISPLILLISPTRTYDQYFIAMVPLAGIIQAILLIGKHQTLSGMWRKVTYPFSIIALSGVGVAGLWLAIDGMQQTHNLLVINRNSIPSIETLTHFRDVAVRPGIETIFLVDGAGTHDFEQTVVWQMLDYRGVSRVIWGDSIAFPIPEAGATYIGYNDAPYVPEVYSMFPSLVFENTYRAVYVPPGNAFVPSCKPEGNTRLENGVEFIGYAFPQEISSDAQRLKAGQNWTIYLLWRAKPNTEQRNYQLFIHLTSAGSGDTKFAQRDQATLNSSLWRAGDQVVSKVTLTPSENLPMGEPLLLRVGMYSLPTPGNLNLAGVKAIDDLGQPAGDWITIPVCENK